MAKSKQQKNDELDKLAGTWNEEQFQEFNTAIQPLSDIDGELWKGSGMKHVIIRKDTYFDSILLMQVNLQVQQLEGVATATVAMGTPHNMELLKELGYGDEVAAATPADLIIALKLNENIEKDGIVSAIDELLKRPKQAMEQDGGIAKAVDLDSAVELNESANLALISVAGQYAGYVSEQALKRDLNVFLFSDNVSVEEEIALKQTAGDKGLLVMGPDCGTAIINGLPLGFANEVRRGPIGLVGASGTGIQEITVLIDRFGSGISQAIGTGGRDLSEKVGGASMLQGIAALDNDPHTEVIVVVSKPPAKAVADKVLAALAQCSKPSVVHFLGTAPTSPADKVTIATCLEETAQMAVCMATGCKYEQKDFTLPQDEIDILIDRAVQGISPCQTYIRGYFTGGTLCDEALFIMSKKIDDISSNIHPNPDMRPADPLVSTGNSVIDLGDDTFTQGRPHPMIDPSIRTERIEQEAAEHHIALMLFDVVLGHGSCEDPAGSLVPALKVAHDKAKERGDEIVMIASVCGTDADPQQFTAQKRILEEAGVIVMPSNAQAARLATHIYERCHG